MDYAQFVRVQQAAIIEQYFAPTNRAWVAVPDTGWLGRRQTLEGGRVEAMLGLPAADALVWRDDAGRYELWVKPEEKHKAGTDLYARAWSQFVKLVGKTTQAANVNGHDLAIDHLYPETAAARLGLSYVRVMAVDRRSNSLLGSTIETAAARDKTGSLRPRLASAFTIAKVSGFQGSFAKRHDSAGIATALLAWLRQQGYPVPSTQAGAELEQSLTASSIDWYRGTR